MEGNLLEPGLGSYLFDFATILERSPVRGE